jgi:hypothetical protein
MVSYFVCDVFSSTYSLHRGRAEDPEHKLSAGWKTYMHAASLVSTCQLFFLTYSTLPLSYPSANMQESGLCLCWKSVFFCSDFWFIFIQRSPKGLLPNVFWGMRWRCSYMNCRVACRSFFSKTYMHNSRKLLLRCPSLQTLASCGCRMSWYPFAG